MSADTTTPLSAEDLALIRQRCEQASPPPWLKVVYGGFSRTGGTDVGVKASDHLIYRMPLDRGLLRETHDQQKADATFIAAAREDIPRLLAYIEALDGRNRVLEQACAELRRQRDYPAGECDDD